MAKKGDSTSSANDAAQEEIARLMEANARLVTALENVSKPKEKEVNATLMNTAIARHRPTKYEGDGVPSLLDSWFREFDNIFEALSCPSELKVDQAAFYLRGKAGLWWTHNKDDLRKYYKEVEGSDSIFWEGFKRLMRDEFVPEHIRHKMSEKFDQFRMTDEMTLEEYHNQFMELSTYASDLNMSSETLASRFERGLSLSIMKRLPVRLPNETKDVRSVYLRAGHAERLAEMTEGMKKDKGEKRKVEKVSEGSESSGKKGSHTKSKSEVVGGSSFGGGASYGGGMSNNNKDSRVLNSPFGWRCYNCDKMGHKAADCWSAPRNGDGGTGRGNYQTPAPSVGSNRNPGQWNNQRSYNNKGAYGASYQRTSGGNANTEGRPTGSESKGQGGMDNSGK